MEKPKFTPGPWRLEFTDGDTWVEAEFQTVATCVSSCDAYLIAAAPKLYETLNLAKVQLDWVSVESDDEEIRSRCAAVSMMIDKAISQIQ